jgi:uncharacterized protein YndB with AHSA1/START domain
MLRVLGIIAALVVLAVGGVLAYAATKPDRFAVSRSIAIEAPPEKIFPLINDLRAFNTWNPFYGKDPAAKFAYAGPASGKGARHTWEGNSEVGAGAIEIVEASEPARVAMRLDMTSPMEAHNDVEFTLVPDGGQTKVTWLLQGPQPFLGKVMDTIFGMDAMVGGEFEKGLASLKTKAEGS